VDAVLGVNLRGTFLVARAALPHMKAKRYGRFVFTSSITGPRVTSPGHGHYSASKAGINGFIKSAALEFSAYNITVNGVEPGNILTEGMQQLRSDAFILSIEEAIPLGRLGTPRDVAQAALFLVRTRRPISRYDNRGRWRADSTRRQGLPARAGVILI
jgi:3-oxoacyl-[acyl-carrier protein] reductase